MQGRAYTPFTPESHLRPNKFTLAEKVLCNQEIVTGGGYGQRAGRII